MTALNESPLLFLLLLGLLGSLGALLPACVVLFVPASLRIRFTPYLLSYATGTLLAAALIGLIPEAMSQAPAPTVCATVLGGLVLFFVLEWLVIFRHAHAHEEPDMSHDHHHDKDHGKAGILILVGDAVHNFVDGIAIGSAFMASPALGVSTTLAVVGHEIPQEIGDFTILLANGFSRWKAFLWNGLSGLSTLAGVVVAYFTLAQVVMVVPYALAVAAASFLYIGLADLVPSIHGRVGAASGLWQFMMMLCGIATIAMIPG